MGRVFHAATSAVASAAFSVALFAAALLSVALAPASASAETFAGTPILKNETAIEQLTNNYKDAMAELDAINGRIAELQTQIDNLQAVLPIQQERSNRALKQRYKNQKDSFAVFEVLFESTSLDEFLRQAEYIERVSEATLNEVNRTKELKENLDSAQNEQEAIKAEIDERVNAATAELVAEQDRRASRQSAGIAAAVGQAQSQGGEASVGKAADGGEQPEDFREAATSDAGPLNDGADWHADRDEFITHWAERLNAYLAGSALDGQGANFAMAAWKHNIDPRWSAAISNTESSKGAVCIKPHNAWGWGAADSDPSGLALDWDSWETAIDAHAEGLSKGYGYTISMNGAKSYCPNTWQSWYNKTLGEMARI